jgi:hypothetical protein
LKPPEVRKHLFDIAEACGLIGRFTTGKTFEDYERDGPAVALQREIQALLDGP